jgi:hypothetical protein
VPIACLFPVANTKIVENKFFFKIVNTVIIFYLNKKIMFLKLKIKYENTIHD